MPHLQSSQKGARIPNNVMSIEGMLPDDEKIPSKLIMSEITFRDLHDICGHADEQRCRKFAAKNGLKIMPEPKSPQDPKRKDPNIAPCEGCIEGRGASKRSGSKSTTSSRRDDIISRGKIEEGPTPAHLRGKIFVIKGDVLESTMKPARSFDDVANAAQQLSLIEASTLEPGQLWQADFWQCERPGSELTVADEKGIEGKSKPGGGHGTSTEPGGNPGFEDDDDLNRHGLDSSSSIRAGSGKSIPEIAKSGIRYKLLFVDVLSEYSNTYSAKTKRESLSIFKNFVLYRLPILTGKKLKNTYFVPSIQMDMDTSFKNIENFLNTTGTPFRYSDAHNHRRNGVVERKQRTIPGMLRSVLFSNKTVPFQFWPIIFDHMVLVDNILPSRALGWKSPYEFLFKKNVPTTVINMLHPIGKIAWIDVKVTKQKLKPRAKKAIYLGIANDDEDLSTRSMIFAHPKRDSLYRQRWYFVKRSLKQFRWSSTNNNSYILRNGTQYSEPKFSTWDNIILNYVESIKTINSNYDIGPVLTEKGDTFPITFEPARPVQRGIHGNSVQDAISRPAKSRATGIPPRSSRGTWGTTEALTPEEEEQISRDNDVAEALAETEAGTGLFTPPRTRSSNKILFTDMPEEFYVHHFTNDEVGAAAYSRSGQHPHIEKLYDDDSREDEFVSPPSDDIVNLIHEEQLQATTSVHTLDLTDLDVISRVVPNIEQEISPALVNIAKRTKGKRKRLTKIERNKYSSDSELDKFHPPKSLKDATSRETSKLWVDAAVEEMNSLLDQNTFTLMPRDQAQIKFKNLEILPSHPVFVVKRSGRYKFRQVCGARNQETVHKDVYAPTIRLDTFKTLCAAAVQKGLYTYTADFSNAYLHAEMPKNKNIAIQFREKGILQLIANRIPSHFKNEDGVVRGDLVGVLNKSLYGLANAGKLWGDLLSKTLKNMGFKRSTLDPCCYYNKNYHGGEMHLCVFVDDIAAFTNNPKAWEKFLAYLRKQKFKLTVEGLTSFLGATITTSNDGESISLSQEPYLESMAIRFASELRDVKPKDTPLPTKTSINMTQCPKDEKSQKLAKSFKFREMIGCLIWLSVYTRPDLLYPTTQLAQVMSNPSKDHYNLLKRVVMYAIASKGRKLTYTSDGQGVQLKAYVDANFNTDDTGRSNAGWCITISGAEVMSSSKIIKQWLQVAHMPKYMHYSTALSV